MQKDISTDNLPAILDEEQRRQVTETDLAQPQLNSETSPTGQPVYPLAPDIKEQVTEDPRTVNQVPQRASKSHNRMICVADILERSAIHERELVDPDDIDRQMPLARQPGQWMTFYVVEEAGKLRCVDGSVLLAAINEIDPTAEVPFEIVDLETALTIRNKDHEPDNAKEPMAKCRRALILREQGKKHSEIAVILKVMPTDPTLSDGRISQMISAAKTERRFVGLRSKTDKPHQIPINIWEGIRDTLKCHQAFDDKNPSEDELGRKDAFIRKIQKICDDDNLYTLDDLCNALGLNARTSANKRGRTIGDPVDIPGFEEKLWFAADRVGGAVINLPPNLTNAENSEILQKSIEAVALALSARKVGLEN